MRQTVIQKLVHHLTATKRLQSLLEVIPARTLTIWRSYRHIATPWGVALACGGIFTALIVTYLVLFLWPQSIIFSYSKPSCFTTPPLFPGLVTTESSPTYRINLAENANIAGHSTYSKSACVTAQRAPQQYTTEHVHLTALGKLISKDISITTSPSPTVHASIALNKPIPAKAPLVFNLSEADTIFEYQLMVDGHITTCPVTQTHIACNLATLSLQQSKSYTFTLQRLFHGQSAQTVFTDTFSTVEPIQVTGSSISQNQVIYNTPLSITLQLSKAATNANATLDLITSDNKAQSQATTITIHDTTMTIAFSHALPRSSNFTVSVTDVTAADGGYLVTPYALSFSTSGGPKVTGISIGSTRVATNSSITLTFDTPILASQDIQPFIGLQANGSAVASTITKRGNSVTITPQANLGRCASLVVSVANGLQNEFGISGNAAWQFKARTLCQTTFSIGTSVQGRDITAYSFGTGSVKIIFVGNTHGNEKSSAYILNDWINYLENNPAAIPADRTIIVIPKLNPDGFAANTRTNAHGVDLNRNFPANNWKSGVIMPDLTYQPTGGGSTPLSEPESLAIANFVITQKPRLVLTYHAVANIVAPNGSGDSTSLANIYANKSTVNFLADDQSAAEFAYDTTGAFEDWLHDKYSIPALLVELSTNTGYEFSGHRAAMLDMITR